jgi:SAM-dependent methyltransferase
MKPEPLDPAILDQMRKDWDERASENARYYIATANTEWDDAEFFESGRINVRQEILTDMANVCQGRDPRTMTVLEIGCGTGRMTRALAEVFGEVYGVDVSGEMIRRAKESLRDYPNAHVFRNDGAGLTVLGDIRFDFAFSFIVFQHIPSRDIIYNYVREVGRLLRPGALFKFQVQGSDVSLRTTPADTWVGVTFSDADAVAMADACGFELRYRHGAGSEFFWLWFFDKKYQGTVVR